MKYFYKFYAFPTKEKNITYLILLNDLLMNKKNK